MVRFFAVFAVVCATACLAALGLGWGIPAVEAGPRTHLLVGLGAVILTSSLHCLVFAIFTGAGKDTRELVQELGLDRGYVERVKGFRRLVFPIALWAILYLVMGAVFGGALSGIGVTPAWRWAHEAAMLWAIAYNLRAFRIEYLTVKENAAMLAEVNRLAAERIAARPQPVAVSALPEVLQGVAESHEWGAHVYALGRFLCFLGYNVWLPWIYLRLVMGELSVSVWPFLVSSAICLGGGAYLRMRYWEYRPSPSRAPA